MSHTPGRLKVGRISHSSQSVEIDAESNAAWMGMYPWEGLAECRGCNEHKTRGSEVMEANARRLVAAWNACEGIPTEVLENLADDGATVAPIYRDLLVQRDELLEALKCLLSLDDDHQRGADDQDVCAEVQRARAAVAKVEGKA